MFSLFSGLVTYFVSSKGASLHFFVRKDYELDGSKE